MRLSSISSVKMSGYLYSECNLHWVTLIYFDSQWGWQPVGHVNHNAYISKVAVIHLITVEFEKGHGYNESEILQRVSYRQIKTFF